MNAESASRKTRWPMLARYTVAALFAVICLLVYLSGDYFNETVRKLSEELFLALCAAIVIILMIDVPSREELREDIKTEIDINLEPTIRMAAEIRQHALDIEENAYKTAFSGKIPRDFVNAIQTKAFKGPFLRENLRATWRFEIKDGGRLLAQVDSSSLIKNITDSFQIYSPRFYFDQRQGDPKLQKLSINGVPQDMNTVKLESGSGSEPDLVLTIPDQEVQPHGQVEILTDFTFERSCTDWELWTTLYPCRSMNLRVYYPDPTKCKKEYFKIDQLGDLFLKRHDHDTYVDVDVQDKILPDQGLMFAWRFVPTQHGEKPSVIAPSAASPNTPAAS